MNPLLRKVIGESDITQGSMEVDPQDLQRLVGMVHDRFIDERTNGFVHPETRQQVPGISPEEAERLWQRCAAKFQKSLSGVQPGSYEAEKTGMRHREVPARYTHPQAQ